MSTEPASPPSTWDSCDGGCGDAPARRDYLNKTVDPVPRSRMTTWQQPRDIHTIEWFASATDICAAYT